MLPRGSDPTDRANEVTKANRVTHRGATANPRGPVCQETELWLRRTPLRPHATALEQPRLVLICTPSKRPYRASDASSTRRAPNGALTALGVIEGVPTAWILIGDLEPNELSTLPGPDASWQELPAIGIRNFLGAWAWMLRSVR